MRTDTRLCVGIFGIVVLLGLCGIAHAQTPGSSLPNLSLLIGERIEVTNDDGSVFTGQLTAASETSLMLDLDRKQTALSLSRIREISRLEKDSVADGILIGAAIGAATSAVTGAVMSMFTDEPMIVYLLLPGLGTGMAIGWIGDALLHRKIQIFPVKASRVAIATMLSADRKGVAARLRF
jgi:hypothetical protein